MFEAELKELGLTDNEAKVYISLLENGILNPTHLAEKTGMHRSYIYDTLERLMEKGIINTVLIDNKKNYQPVDPTSLREIFELKLRKIDYILPQLSNLYKATKKETRVELHRGKRVYLTLIKDLIANLEEDEIIFLMGVNEDLLDHVEPIYLKQYLNIIKIKNVKEKIIIPKGTRKLNRANLEYKEINPAFIGNTTTVIHKNKVYVFILDSPYHLIVIESGNVADSYKKQFEIMWNISK
jgi:HTH-type transcriptional regulator, sugar sensing transcriptional regulator